MTSLVSRFTKSYCLLAIPLAALLCAACTDGDIPLFANGDAAPGADDGAAVGSDSGGSDGSAASDGAESDGASTDGTTVGSDSGGSDGGAPSDGGPSDGGAVGSDSGSDGGAVGSDSGSDGGAASDGGPSDSGSTDAARADASDASDAGPYVGPSVGKASTFAALAYSELTTANITGISGELGVSAGAVSKITGFDAPTYVKYGTDSLAPNDQRTMLAQQDVTALVGNIDPRPCDADYTNVPGGLTGNITLYPGVTCMNSFTADVLVNGQVTLDARGNPNAFFVIRGNKALTVADGAQVILVNGAEACGVFWRISTAVTIGKTVAFYGNVIAGTAITMNTSSTLIGRALAQTAGVHFDANTITIPTNGLVGAPGVCTHVQ